jgi:acyl-CoA reductase-like NAD-dependent aldehyde dehydrogenase
VTPFARRVLLIGLARLVEEHSEQLATILTLETGLPLGVTQVSARRGAVGAGSRGSVTTPFGGVKASGYGREGGRVGVQEFFTEKNVYIGLS